VVVRVVWWLVYEMVSLGDGGLVLWLTRCLSGVLLGWCGGNVADEVLGWCVAGMVWWCCG